MNEVSEVFFARVRELDGRHLVGPDLSGRVDVAEFELVMIK